MLSFTFFHTSLMAFEDSKEDNTTVHIDSVSFDGLINKEESSELNAISKNYIHNNLTIAGIERLKNKLSAYYKNRGMVFTKVTLVPQDLSSGTLKFSIVKTKVEDVNVTGNKYYSTSFIKRNFHFKSGEYLSYDKMLQSLLLLNEYEDLSVKSYLKKGSAYGTTDVNLEVQDERPFHGTLTLDNLGSKDTSKNRVSADINYGNLVNDGDNISLSTTFGLDTLKTKTTKLILLNYETTPIGTYSTRLNFGYLYADYITAGDLSVLELKGDTYIYTFGIKQPLLYSSTTQLDLLLDYYQKNIKSYLLGSLSSEDDLGIIDLKLNLKYRRVYDSFECSIGGAKGVNGDDSLSSRYGADIDFTKYMLRASYNRYVNSWNSFVLSLDSQYSANRLPLSELYTIGGLSSVRAYEPAQKLGDSGYVSNIEWFFHPKLDYYGWLKNSTQIGIYADYGKIFNNSPVPGEEKSSSLSALGGELLVNINKKYFARISVGYPLHSSDVTIKESTHVYGYVGIKLW
jgi:hemolysin activation/secretion protein